MKYEGWKVGRRIKTLRKKKCLTAEELSLKLGVSSSHISQIEQGYRKMSLDLMYRLMNELEVDANTLLAIPQNANDKNNISIDDELLDLPCERQKIFKNLFLQMIKQFSG